MEKIDKLAAAQNCNRDTPSSRPGAKQSCADIVNISIFFDGTGNNKDVDEPLMSWSNPARLWRATQFLTNDGTSNYSIYISGVGTPFNGTATDWMDQKLMAVQDGKLGLGFGSGGTRRLDDGEVRVNDRLRTILVKNASKLNLSLLPYIEKGKPANIRGLAQALEEHGLITVINLSIFGFSRGAALARAFSNEMVRQSKRGADGTLRYNGVPIRFNFMGLFDTVASFGAPGKDVDLPFDEKNLVVPVDVERCVHYVAAHELRFSFPVDLIRKGGKLPPNWSEIVYPGAHSDVGGGYEPVNQGISNNYARIPMRDMMREAVRCGVRLVDYDDIRKLGEVIFRARFEISPETLGSYKSYMSGIGASATVEAAVTAHMKALYASWGTMTRRAIKTPDLVEADDGAGGTKSHGHPGIAIEAARLLEWNKDRLSTGNSAAQDNTPGALNVEGRRLGFLVRPAQWRLDAWQATASEPVLHFIRYYVHDSKAGFINAIEPFSYFTARGMAESSRNVLARGLDWMGDTLVAVKDGIIKVYHRAEGVVVETWEEGKLVATHTYQVGQKFAVDTVRAGVKYTVEVYQSGKEVLISTVRRGEQMIVTSIDTAKKQASAAADATHKKASELIDVTQKKVGEITDATQKKVTEVGSQIYDGASSAVKSVGSAADSGMQAVEEGWHSVRSAIGI
ncbi:T6SS phospholipase effector Tle1-like catalytic domain-containing protein [Pseudoduganella plicata]|uniref:DUF2235 domain-containing protein n=1 Tax=Pseudoduganella plicata TaxID=321984 RepID=A0A4P7BC21_9BURK|nr:DUF2235 domain-containing protein [Pseudoduganella plicata]QBQ35643.1 DUF2235 domain-containing protein [Pseudoduganella plicata]GGY96351.1 hypothetical protein GCM10007388_32270 [Pseudoduganella plicata]